MENTRTTTDLTDLNPGQLDSAKRVDPADLPRNYRVSRCTSCEGGRYAVAWKGGAARPACPKCGAAMTTTTRNLKAGFVVLEGEALELAERLEGGLLNYVHHHLERARHQARRADELEAGVEAGTYVRIEAPVTRGWRKVDGVLKLDDEATPMGDAGDVWVERADSPAGSSYGRSNVNAYRREAEAQIAKAARFRRRLEKLGGPLGAKAVAKAEALASAEAELRGLAPVAGGTNELDVDPETVELSREACWCNELDPRIIEGGGRCGSCEARNDVENAEARAELERRGLPPQAGGSQELDPPAGYTIRPTSPASADAVRRRPLSDYRRELRALVLAGAAERWITPRGLPFVGGDVGAMEARGALLVATNGRSGKRYRLTDKGIKAAGIKAPAAGGTNELDERLEELSRELGKRIVAKRADVERLGRIARGPASTGHTYIAGQAAAAAAREVEGLELVARDVRHKREAGNPRVAELMLKGVLGDKIAARAARAYRTDAELEAAELEAAAADYTDGGAPAPQTSRPAPAPALSLFDE